MKPSLRTLTTCLIAVFATVLSSCAVQTSAKRDSLHVMEVSVPLQKMALYKQGALVKTYPVSTSKYGLGDEEGSYRTPLGAMEVAEKIGEGKPAGAVFKSREWTGEVIKPNSPGRDPIVSRILWLNGLEPENKNAYSRCIYIHGTAAESDIGKPVSYGCVRMKSRDIIDLYGQVGEGSKVFVVKKGLWRDVEAEKKSREPIREIPLSEVIVPEVMTAVGPTATRAVPLAVPTFTSGYEVLAEDGFHPQELKADKPAAVRP